MEDRRPPGSPVGVLTGPGTDSPARAPRWIRGQKAISPWAVVADTVPGVRVLVVGAPRWAFPGLHPDLLDVLDVGATPPRRPCFVRKSRDLTGLDSPSSPLHRGLLIAAVSQAGDLRQVVTLQRVIVKAPALAAINQGRHHIRRHLTVKVQQLQRIRANITLTCPAHRFDNRVDKPHRINVSRIRQLASVWR
jgi:hypothetical protein